MSGLAHHLLKRGLDATHQNLYQGAVQSNDGDKHDRLKSIPLWGIFTLWATLLLFIFVHFVVSRPVTQEPLRLADLVA